MVLEARAYNGLDKMAIIKAVAEAVPSAHTVDLTHPTKTILVQVVKVTTESPLFAFFWRPNLEIRVFVQ